MALEVSKYGYVYVEIPEREEVESRKRHIIFHDEYNRNKLSGEISCILKPVIPVHIGSGIFELATDAGITNFNGVVKGMVKENGLPVIPGSSLKGVFRSITEAISYSCLNQNCQAEDNKLCIACGIFGAMGFMGRISFTSATIKDINDYKNKKANHNIPKSIAMWPPRRPENGRRFYPYINYLSDDFWSSVNKDQFNITVGFSKQEFSSEKVVEPYDFIPEDVDMIFSLKFENLEDKEIGLILTGMGIGPDNQPIFHPHLGGSKPFCFGGLEVRVDKIKVYRNNLEAFKGFGKDDIINGINGWINGKICAFFQKSPNENENLLFEKGLQQIKEILHYPTALPVKVI